LGEFTNAEAAAAIGLTDMHRSGRVFGNIQSRIDFACYLLDLPPLGLLADAPFDMAWSQQDRDWAFPIATMQAAARARAWREEDFELVLNETERLPGQAHISWKRAINENEAKVRAWASRLADADPNKSAAARDDEANLAHRFAKHLIYTQCWESSTMFELRGVNLPNLQKEF